MAENKITVTWDDLKTRKVDSRLKEQDALSRNRQYARMDESSLPQAGAAKPSVFARLWHNSVFALALFGFLGGVAAWACGASLQFRADVKADAERRMQEIHRINDAAEKGALPRAEADAATERTIAAGRRDNPYFAILTDPTLTDAANDPRLPEIVAQDRVKGYIHKILGFGASGVMIALFLAIALPVTERNLPAAVINGSVGAALGLVGGVIVSLLVDKVRDAVAIGPDGQTNEGRQVLARIVVGGVLGLFLTAAPGVVMRNVKKFAIGLFGGLMGGMIGGALHDPIAEAALNSHRFAAHAEGLAELAAMLAIGVIAGISTGLIENAAKTGWLRVTQGLIAGKQFILYRNPTFVGSGPDCQIYLFKDPKVGRRHAAIHIVPGGFEVEDLPLGDPTYVNGKTVARSRLRNGDHIQIGATSLVFQEKTPAA